MNHYKNEDIKTINIFGNIAEINALAKTLSLLYGQVNEYNFSECVSIVKQSCNSMGENPEKENIIVLCDSSFSYGPAQLSKTFYELRFKLEWLGPIVIVAYPHVIKEIEKTDLFRISQSEEAPFTHKCISYPIRLGFLGYVLSNLTTYGRFTWEKIKKIIQDKKLITSALNVRRLLAEDMNSGADLIPRMKEMHSLLYKSDKSILKFINYHINMSLIKQALSENGQCENNLTIAEGAEELLRATERLPKL